jgi:hypothetical protein
MSDRHVNFIPDYVDQKNPDIQWDIACRKEFFVLRSNPEKKNIIDKNRREFFFHQQLVEAYSRIYDRIFVVHETGTGKAGTIINIVDNLIMNKSDKKVFVLQPGTHTKEDFKKQILKLTSHPDLFYSNIKTDNPNVRKYQIQNNIRKYYNIETYQIFTTTFEKKNLTEDQIIEEYSDSCFFLDEIHRLRNQKQNDSIDGDPENIYKVLWKIFHIAKRIKIVLLTATPMINSTDDFVPLLNLILPADKQLPTSWNYNYVNIRQLEYYFRGYISYIKNMDLGVIRKEMGKTINYKHKIKISNDKTTIKPTIKKIEDNKIITVRDDMKQPISEIHEETIPSSVKIFPLEMTGLQRDIYLNCIKNIKIKNFRQDELNISIAIFPDGSYGEAGFKKNIKFNYDNYEFTPYFFSYFKLYDEIKEYDKYGKVTSTIKRRKSNLEILEMIRPLSAKYYFFIKNEVFKEHKLSKRRCSFVYLNIVKGSGLIYFGLLLKLFGYENFDRDSVFKRIRLDDGSYIEKIDEFPKKRRFSIITSVTKQNTESILELMNSEENTDGEYIQILCASRIARDGINIFNVQAGYLFASDWHESGMHQALSRFYRADSFLNLQKKYPDEEIYIEVYRLASILNDEDMILLKNIFKKIKYDKNKILEEDILEYKKEEDLDEKNKNLNKGNEEDKNLNEALDDEFKKEILEEGINSTFDIDIYLLAEKKNIYEKKIIYMMKSVAFDGFLNYDRNTYGNFKDYSKEEDYSKKFFRLWSARGEPNNDKRIGIAKNQGPNRDELNYNTYNLYYKKKGIWALINKIKVFSERYDDRTIDKLILFIGVEAGIKNYYLDKDIILEAFDIIHNQKIFIKDKFGFKKYIYLIGESIFLNYSPEIVNSDKIFLSNSLEFFLDKKSLNIEKEKINYEEKKDEENILTDLLKLEEKEIFDYLKNPEIENSKRFVILENSLINYINTKNKDYLKIINCFYYYVYAFKIPKEYFEITEKKIKETKINLKGKPRNENSFAGLKNIFDNYERLSDDYLYQDFDIKDINKYIKEEDLDKEELYKNKNKNKNKINKYDEESEYSEEEDLYKKNKYEEDSDKEELYENKYEEDSGKINKYKNKYEEDSGKINKYEEDSYKKELYKNKYEEDSDKVNKYKNKYEEENDDYRFNIVHFFEDEKQINSYNVTSVFTRKDKKVRVYNKDKKIFEDAKLSQTKVFNWFILKSYFKRMEYYENFIYSKIIYSKDDNFRIYNFDEKSKGLTCFSNKIEDTKKIFLKFCKQNFYSSYLYYGEEIGEDYPEELKEDELDKISKNIKEVKVRLRDYYGYEQTYIDELDDYEVRLSLYIEQLLSEKKTNKEKTCIQLYNIMKKYHKIIETI